MTFRFSDGSTLVTHSALLAMVSPVLRTAIEDCKHSGSIHLEEESVTWRMALNLIHPNGPNLLEQDVVVKYVFHHLVCYQSSTSIYEVYEYF